MSRENEYAYEPTEIDDELFLSEVPLELLEQSLEVQFNNPLEYRKRDYIQSFITKYEFSANNLYEEERENLEQLHAEFISFITRLFEVKLNIGFPEIEDMDDETQHELIHMSYCFFIKNIKKNFVHYILNYIDKYKDEISDESICARKKDVTTLNFKSYIHDDDDVAILSNLDSVIRYILNQDVTVDEFFELCKTDGNCLETEFIEEKFNTFEITGNFIPDYVRMMDEDFFIEIESKVRNKILKKYPKGAADEIDALPEESEEVED